MKRASRIGIVLVATGLALSGTGQGALAQASGEQSFQKYCAVCHDTEPGKNKLGPSLAGVVGRDAGSLPDYSYSSAMQSSGLKWDEKTLDSYITNPRQLIPGNKMLFLGVKDAGERQAIIAYLGTLKP